MTDAEIVFALVVASLGLLILVRWVWWVVFQDASATYTADQMRAALGDDYALVMGKRRTISDAQSFALIDEAVRKIEEEG